MGTPSLWSLEDMLSYNCQQFTMVFGQACQDMGQLMMKMVAKPDHGSAALSRKLRSSYAESLGWLREHCEYLDLVNSTRMAADIVRELKRKQPISPWTIDRIYRDLEKLLATVRFELGNRHFVFLPPAHGVYLKHPCLFGIKVAEAFPSVQDELRDVGDALAADLGTAAVFHLMRVAERGMKVLAWDRRVAVVRNKPLELQQWKEILDCVEKEVEKINHWPNSLGLAKTQAQEFYNSLLSDFRGFKDAWRNHVMHGRGYYDFSQAVAVLDHVKRFMQLLSERISETNRTSVRWCKRDIRLD